MACEESVEAVKDFISDDCQMLFVTAGMGGGTGTGAAPIVAKIAKEQNILTVAIVTLPFTFEGRKRIQNGIGGLMELRKHVDALVVVSNDKLRLIHANMSMREAFAQADNVLTTAARGIAEIITRPGYVNVDFEDVNSVLRQSGVAIMGIGYSEGEGRAQDAVDQALSCPLLEDNNISGAQDILLNICYGAAEPTMDEVDQIMLFVQEEAGSDANLIWGSCYDDTLEDGISVTVIATGFEDSAIQAISGNSKPAKEVIDLKPQANGRAQRPPSRQAAPSPQNPNHVEFDDVHPRVDEYNRSVQYRQQIARDMQQSQQNRQDYSPQQHPQHNHRHTHPAQPNGYEQGRPAPNANYGDPIPPSNPDDIYNLEREPAILRRKGGAQPWSGSRPAPNQKPSRTVIDENGEPRIGGENPWLYDKAD